MHRKKSVNSHKPRWKSRLPLAYVLTAAWLGRVHAQELPYFITYSHHLEEPGSIEIETKAAVARPADGNRFGATAIEIEYGTRAWWTSELYTEMQTTAHEGSLFTGFRVENRFRPLLREHAVNPVLYVEWEDINAANKSVLEVVGHDAGLDLSINNREAREEKKREVEIKLILSSNFRGWNLSENVITEKNIRHAPWEFGYAFGVSRPLALAGSSHPGLFSAQNFSVGAELYGGLGDVQSLGTHDTSQYLGPTATWSLPRGMSVMASPNFGLNGYSAARIYRVGVSYELGQLSTLLHPRESREQRMVQGAAR